MTEFTKNDASKLRFDLIAPEFLEGLARCVTVGAAKYPARNWEVGADWGRYIASGMRHWNDWLKGEEYDEEGFHHLDGVAFAVMALRTFFARGIGTDDRPMTLVRKRAQIQADPNAILRANFAQQLNNARAQAKAKAVTTAKENW